MKQQQTGLVLLGATLVAIVLAALAYFLLIAPELDGAALATEQTEAARTDNEMLELNILQMQTLEKEVPGWREEVAKISLDLPPTVEQADFERLVTAQLADLNLPVVDVAFAQPSVVDPLALVGFEPPTVIDEEAQAEAEAAEAEAEAEAAAEAAAEENASDDADPTATPEPATPAPPAAVEPPFEGLYAVPVTITTEGDPSNALAFLKAMWSQLDRFYTVTNISIAKADEAEELPGRPALTEDQWTFQVTGLIFSLIDPERSFPPDNEGDVPEFVEGDTATNSFAPLPGTEADSGDSDS